MLVAITGGTGFIGSQLADLHLARGDPVRILVRPGTASRPRAGVEVTEGDVTSDDDRLRHFVDDADVLYHCAAEIHDERRMETTNVRGTRALARLASGRVKRWVQVSSAAVYGKPDSVTVTEDRPVRPDTLYGKTKTEAETAVQAAASGGAYEVTIVRPSNIFGAGMRSTALFRLFEMVKRGWFFFVGKPGALMNYTSVENVAAALIACGTHPAAANRIFNVSEDMPIERFAAIIAEELGARTPSLRLPEPPLRALAALFGRLPGMPLTEARLDALTVRARYSSDRLRQELAYRPDRSLEEGLRELVRHWTDERKNASA